MAAGNVRLDGVGPPASPFLTAVPAQTQTQSDSPTRGNWAGYVAQSASQMFTQAEIWYDEPASYASRCSTTAESTWAGLGGWVSGDQPLAQNGTAIGVPGISAHQAWWEFWPYNDMVPVGFSATQGDKFTAEVTYEGSDAYNFWFYNYANGTSYSLDAETSALTGGAPYGTPSYTAEAIIERPSINNQLSNLTNFGTLTVTSATANNQGFDSYPAALTSGKQRHGVHMENFTTKRDLADPSDVGKWGTFTVTQSNCN